MLTFQKQSRTRDSRVNMEVLSCKTKYIMMSKNLVSSCSTLSYNFLALVDETQQKLAPKLCLWPNQTNPTAESSTRHNVNHIYNVANR